MAVAAHVLDHSADLLGDAQGYAQALIDLGEDASRLVARLLMRSTPVIREDSLNYAEVDDREKAIAELEDAGLIERDGPVPAAALLERLKVAELKSLFAELDEKKDRKQDRVARILCAYTDPIIRSRCNEYVHWITVDVDQHLERVRLTYFGDLYRDLTEFVMRDLGISEFEDYELGHSARAFAQARELDQYLQLASLQRLARQRRRRALTWLFEQPMVAARQLSNRSLLRRRDKLLNEWGRDFERDQLQFEAHQCYERSTAHPARERRIRLFTKADNAVASAQLLDDIRKSPWSAEEALFAQRFGLPRVQKTQKARSKKTSPARVPWRETQWNTPHKQMPDVERRTALELTRNGGQAWHTENGLLQSLLGLVFWDIVFAPEAGMFTHPFQSGPRDLYWPDFRVRRAALINARLEDCADPKKLWRIIENRVKTKAGKVTRLVHWGLVTYNGGEVLAAAKECFSADQLIALFDYMLKDLGQVRSGMPDLFVAYGSGCFELVEVKGPSDQLQPNQRVWLRSLCELGIPCRVIKHKYVAANTHGR